MKQAEVDKFLAKIFGLGLVYAPIRRDGQVFIDKVESEKQIDWSGDMPINSFKAIFFPPKQDLFEVKGSRRTPIFEKKNIIVWGMNILDLQAFSLFEHVFEKDVYYQERRQNIYVVGFTNGITDDFRKYRAFHQTYEENVLEHVMFDVFIERQKNGNLLFFSGSVRGQRLLDDNGVEDYENIEFAGLVTESGIDPRITQNRQAVELNEDHPLWEELGKICFACGKCSITCPTCFCFDQADQIEINQVKQQRQWGNCFYPEFSKIAGGHKDLDTIKKKLYFWYQHKFVRIPDQLGYYGCVSCMRCFKVCPVGINIQKNLQNLKKNKDE